ncbi:MAG: alpha-L-fucosidase, partial [Odoribacter sp.]|nr:alpha-L-fucosidase [Odoribacter sp.]
PGCITLSHSWAWAPGAKYKTSNQVVNILAEITAKGGCLLLGVGPTPEGVIQPEVEESLKGVGKWLRANGKAIYATRTTPHYHDGNVWFTADKDGNTLYAVYALPDDEVLPGTVQWTGNVPEGDMILLGDGRKLRYRVVGEQVTVTLPKGLKKESIALQFTRKR